MSFFEPPPPEPPPPRRYRKPAWIGPPENVVPGIATLELVLVNTGRVAVWVADAEVYPTGVVLKVVLQGREPAEPGVESGEGTWRLGVQFADGRKASAYGLGGLSRVGAAGAASSMRAMALDANASPPDGPVLFMRGGGGNRTKLAARMLALAAAASGQCRDRLRVA